MPLRSFFLLLSSFEKVTLLQHSVLNYQSAHGLIVPTACAFPWRRHSFVFQRSCQFVLIFYPCRKSVFRDTILCCHVLFVIPFSKSFKTLHFTPIGLLFSLRFMGTIFLLQRTKNGLFEFMTLCLCFQKSNAWFENVWMFES